MNSPRKLFIHGHLYLLLNDDILFVQLTYNKIYSNMSPHLFLEKNDLSILKKIINLIPIVKLLLNDPFLGKSIYVFYFILSYGIYNIDLLSNISIIIKL